MKKIVQIINSISELLGQLAQFSLISLIIVLCYEVISRYVFNNPTIWALETSEMLLCTTTVLGFTYTYLYDEHVRVDILYSKLSRRGQAWVNVIMSIIFLFPFLFVLIFSAIERVLVSLKTGERLVESSWLPPAFPIRLILLIGFIFFALQSISKFAQELYFLVRNEELLL